MNGSRHRKACNGNQNHQSTGLRYHSKPGVANFLGPVGPFQILGEDAMKAIPKKVAMGVRHNTKLEYSRCFSPLPQCPAGPPYGDAAVNGMNPAFSNAKKQAQSLARLPGVPMQAFIGTSDHRCCVGTPAPSHL